MAFNQSESLGNYAVLTEFLHLVTVTADVVTTVLTTLALACIDVGRHALHILSEVTVFLTAAFYFLQQCAILLSSIAVVVLDWLNTSSEWLLSVLLRMFVHFFTYASYIVQTSSMWVVETTNNAMYEIYTFISKLVDDLYPYVQIGISAICRRATTCYVALYNATVLFCQHSHPVLLHTAQYTSIVLANIYNNIADSTVPLVLLVTIAAALLVKLPNYLSQRGFTFPSIHRYNSTRAHVPFVDYLTDSDLDEADDEMLDSDSEDDAESNEFSDEDDVNEELHEQTPNSSSEDEENDPNLINVQLPRRSGSGDNAHHVRITPLGSATKPSACELERCLESERDKRLCVVCQDKLKNVLVLPCRHVCLCVDCAHVIVGATTRQQRTCPLCRSPVETVMNVYV